MPRLPTNPLRLLFQARCFGEEAGMNWLQERGYVADSCVGVDDVSELDVFAIMAEAGKEDLVAMPPWQLPYPRVRVPLCSICRKEVNYAKLKCPDHPDAPTLKSAVVAE